MKIYASQRLPDSLCGFVWFFFLPFLKSSSVTGGNQGHNLSRGDQTSSSQEQTQDKGMGTIQNDG